MSKAENNAYNITKKVSIPRLIGTEGERKAREIIVREFEIAGYKDILRENFKTSFYNLDFMRVIFVLSSILIILMGITFFLNPWITLGVILLILFIIFKSPAISTSKEIKLSKNSRKNYETENIFVNLKSINSKAKIIIMGHYDSKGQKYPISLRKNLIIVSTVGTIFLNIMYLTLSLLKIVFFINIPVLELILFVFCIIFAFICILNYFNKTNNKSYGACDNGASVGIIVELARFFKNNPINNIDLTFLLPSSEEINLGGSKSFINKHKNEFKKNSTFFINLDLTGIEGDLRLIDSYGIPKKNTSKMLSNLIKSTAGELDIGIRSLYVPTGIWSDLLPIVSQGFEACWIATLNGIKTIHTSKDCINQISKIALKNLIDLIIAVIKKLENTFEV